MALAPFANQVDDLVGRDIEINALDIERGARGWFRLHDVASPVPATDSHGTIPLGNFEQGRQVLPRFGIGVDPHAVTSVHLSRVTWIDAVARRPAGMMLKPA